MNQENTKHKFHEVLKWIADGEQIEYKNDFNEWVSTLNEDVLSAITCAGNSYYTVDRFRIKPKSNYVTAVITDISHEYTSDFYSKATLTCLERADSVTLNDMFMNGKRVVILTEQCYNDLLGNSTLNLKGNKT